MPAQYNQTNLRKGNHNVTKSLLRIVMLMTLLMGLAGAGSAYAHGDGDGDLPRGSKIRALSYIDPDPRLPTANPSVNDNSSCEDPDRYDRQRLSTGSKDRNVHNDACLVKNRERVSRPVSWRTEGVGYISACPDPDLAGPETARTEDTDGDGFADECYQSAYEEANEEFHLRLNNFDDPGLQKVTFCFDSDQDGCDDASDRATDRITIKWLDN